MSVRVVDASVAVKWFLPEPHSIEALRLLKGQHQLLAPDLLFAECGNVLWKKWRQQELEQTVITEILNDLRRTNLIIVPTSALLEEAATIAVSCNRSFSDSTYLAVASMSDGQFVTADEKLFNALQQTGLAKMIVHVKDLSN